MSRFLGNYRATLLLSAIMHGSMLYAVLTHPMSEIKPVMSPTDLTHYMRVRLQLSPVDHYVETEPVLVEEALTAKTVAKSTRDHVRPTPRESDDYNTENHRKPVTLATRQNSRPQKMRAVTPVRQTARKTTLPSLPIADNFSPSGTTAATTESHRIEATPKENSKSQGTGSSRITKTEKRRLQQAYWSRLTRFFKHKGYHYPKQAILEGQEGKVYIVVEIDPRGRIVTARISKSSGFPLLDQSALETVLAVGEVPNLPTQLSNKNRKFKIPFEYRLPS